MLPGRCLFVFTLIVWGTNSTPAQTKGINSQRDGGAGSGSRSMTMRLKLLRAGPARKAAAIKPFASCYSQHVL
jgi:hypothetical protein